MIIGQDIYKYGCGHEVRMQERLGEDHEHYVSGPCHDCKQKLIGTRQTVIRYGNLPKSGRSYNYRDSKQEDGVSCYLLSQRPRAEFAGRTAHIVSAIIIGYGSDDEPLIDALTIE